MPQLLPRTSRLAMLLAAVATAGLAACRPGPPPDPGRLPGTNWVVDRASLGVPVPEAVSVTANFSATAVSGSSGCNVYTAEYQATDGMFSLGLITSTARACEPAVSAVEHAFIRKLSAARTYRIEGDRLTLSDSSGGSVRFEGAPAANPAG